MESSLHKSKLYYKPFPPFKLKLTFCEILFILTSQKCHSLVLCITCFCLTCVLTTFLNLPGWKDAAKEDGFLR